MSTEADVAKPICETRGEQGEDLVYQPTTISIGKLHQEEKIQADTYNELSTLEGEFFLKTPSIDGEVHYEVNKNSPDVSKVTEKLSHVKDESEILPLGKPNFDDQPVEIAADEESSSEGIQQNVEKSNDLEKDNDRGMVMERCRTDSQVMTSEIKGGDTLHHPNQDDARVETEQSNEMTNDHHGTNDSFTEKIALPQEMLQESNLPSEEIKKFEETALQSEELNVHVEMTDEKAGDERKTEEDISCNLTTDVSRGECDQNKKTSEPDGLGKERNIEDDLDTGADKGSRENIMFTETTSNETSNSVEFQSKSNLNSFFNKEDDIAIQNDDSPATTSEDSIIILENTLNESSGDVESQSKILEDNATNHSDPDLRNKSEESSCIQADGSQIKHDEQSEEGSKNLILTEVSRGGTSNSESTAIAKVKDEDEDLKKAELFENENNTSTFLKGDEQMENPAQSLNVSTENIEASNLSQENEKGKCPEDQSTDINLYENTGGETEEKSIDAVNTQKEILESISTIAPSSSEEGSTNAVLPEVPCKDINESIIDADTKIKVIEDFSTISNVNVEGNSMSILDGIETKNEEHLGNESEKPSLPLPFSREATNKDETILLHEDRIEDGEERKAEFCENETTAESMVLKIDSKIEKSEDSLSVISEKIKEPDVDQVIEISSFDEQNVSIHPQGILDDKTENATVNAAETKEEATEIHDAPTIVQNEKTDEDSLIKDDGPEKENEKQLDRDTELPSLIKDFTGNNLKDEVKIEDERTEDKTIDVAITSEETQELQNVSNKNNEDSLTQVDASNIEQNAYLKEEVERLSLKKAPLEDAKDNESTILVEPEIDNECPKEVELLDSEKNVNNTLLEKKDLQDAPEDHTASISSADIETTRSFDEESLVMKDNTIDVADSKEVTLEVQNVATKIQHEHMEENSFAQANCSQIEQEKHLEDSENSFSPDTPTEEINSNESKDIHESENSSKDSIKVALEYKIYTESASVKGEAQVEKPVEDIKASDSSQDSNSIKEQISTADPQEISSDKTKKESIDAAEGNEESLEPQDIATNTSDGDNADNSPTEDGSENSHLKEATTWKTIDEPTVMHEAEIVIENERSAECTLVKEEVHIEPSRLAADEVGESALGQDRETSTPNEQNLTTYPQGIMDDSKENKTSEATNAEQGTPEDKDIPKSTPYEEIEENLHIQLDCSQLEQSEDLENGSENTSLREASTGETIKSTSVKEKAQEEKPIDSLRVAEEEIKTPIACQETSSTEEKTLVPNEQEISCNNTEERDIDAYTEKEYLEDVATNVPNGSDENNSPIEVGGSQKPSSEEATTGNNNDEESIVTQEPELAGEKENHIECTLSKDEVHIESLQVAAHDIKASALGQERETSTLVEQTLTTTPQGVTDYTKEDKRDDATHVEEQIPEDKDIVKTTPYEDIEEKLLDQVDCSQMEQNEDLKKGIDNKPLIEAPVGDVIERTLANEEAQVEKPIESLQVTSSSCQETSSIEEKILPVNLQEISCDTIEEKTIDATHTKENLESNTTSSHENILQDSLVPVDCSQPEHNEHSENENESASLQEALSVDTTKGTLVYEEAPVENHIEPLQVAMEDIKAFAPCQDRETSSTEEQFLTADPDDVSRDKKIEKIDAIDKEITLEVQDDTRNVPHGDNLSIATEDTKDHESTITREVEFVDESLQKYDFLDHEKKTEDTLVKEDIFIEISQEAVENINTSNVREDIETISQEEQIRSENLGRLIEEDNDGITIGSTDQQEETPNDEVPKEIEIADHEAKKLEFKEEISYLEDLQITTTVNRAAHEEKDSNSAAEKLPCTEDLIVNDDVVGHTSEDPNWKQKESSSTNVSEEYTMSSTEEVPGITGLESETPERNKDHKVVEEANTCGDKIDAEKIGVLDYGSITIPTNGTFAETDPRESTEADVQVSNGEEAELVQEDLKTETVQKDIEEQLFINASQFVSESKGVNGDEETSDSDNCKATSGSSNSVALKEVTSFNVAIEENLTSNSFQEASRETRGHDENEEAQLQEEKLHVSAHIQDSSTQKVEEDIQLCVASANDSDVTLGMQEVEEVPLLAPEEKITETKECKETEVEEGATRNKEQDDTIEIFLDDKKATEKEQEETKSTQEEVTLDEEVKTTKSTSVPEPNDFLPVPLGHIPEVDHSITGREATTDKEELHTGEKAIEDNEETKIQEVRDDDEPLEQKTSEVSPAASILIEAENQEVATLMSEAPEEAFTEKYMIEANDPYKAIDTTEGSVINESTSLQGILVNNVSTTDVESNIDEKAPDILEPIPTATEGQDVESTNVTDTSTYIGGTTEEKSDSTAPEQPKSGYEPKNQVLESVAQVQDFDTISETEDTKIEEEYLKTADEIKSEKIVAQEILEQKENTYEEEIIKDNISSQIKEEGEDVEDSHEEEVIKESHLEEEAKQGEEITTKEIFEVIKNENEIEKVSKIYKVADDKAPEEQEENLLENESIDRSLHQEEQAKSVEEDATILHTEGDHGLGIAYVKTGTYDSNKEINNSTVAFPEEEDNITGAGDTDNETAECEGLLKNSKVPAIDAAAELPKGLNEYVICEAPPTATVHKEETKFQEVRDDDKKIEQKTSEVSPAAPISIEAENQEVATTMSEAPEEDFTEKYMIEANDPYKGVDTREGLVVNESTIMQGILVNNGSTTDLESKIDEEAPDILEPIPTATEGQDIESASVRETSTYIGGTTEEKSDSIAPEQPKSEYEPKNQVLKSIAQVQAYDIISETEGTKIEEESLKTAEEIKSEEIVAQEILEQKETTFEKEIIKDNISSQKIKDEGEDLEDCHQDSYEEEMSKIYKEADDKAPEEQEENLLANESIDRSHHQKEQAKSVEEDATILHTEEGPGLDIAYVKTESCDSKKEINSSTVAFPEEEDNRTGAGDTDNEMAEYEGLLKNSKIPAIDAAAELPKGLNEDIIYEAPPTATVHKTTEDFEAEKGNANAIMTLQQEDSTTKLEILPELAQGKESEEQSQKHETCSSNEMQAEDEEKLKPSGGKSEENKADTWRELNEEDKETCVEANLLDCSSDTKSISEYSISNGAHDIAEDNENSDTKIKSSEEGFPNKSIGSQIPNVSDEIELTEQASKATRISPHMKKPEGGIDSRATISNATGVESRQVEDVNDKCEVMEETSTPVDSHMASNIIQECTVGSSLEVKDQQAKPLDLPKELNMRDTEVDFAEKDDPENLQKVRDINEDVQDLNEGSFEASDKDNPVEVVRDGNIQTSERQETEGIQIAVVPEILKQETEDHKLGRTSESVSKVGVNCEEEKTINEKTNQFENSGSAETENVSESNIHQSSVNEVAQTDKNKESHPDSETAEKDLPLQFAGFEGTNATDLEVTPLPSKDKHIVLEADHNTSPYAENSNGKENISPECVQGELEIQKPSKVEQEEPDCGNEERTGQKTREKLELEESNKPSLSEKEPATHGEDLKAERIDDAEHEDAKFDEEKGDEEESSEQKRSELSEAPVMVDMGDADVKVSHKKSHNILSGVGSKVKHSIAKVKKAITGKSSHPKPPSPKKVIT